VRFVFVPFGSEPAADPEATIGCDGLPPAQLCLSHWPGNSTPAELRRELSTGIALAFARIPRAEREARFGAFEFVANDHFDTDGLLAAFACLEPEAALAREEILLTAARAGDYWCAPTRRSLAFDAAVSAFTDPARSPLASELAPLAPAGRNALAYAALLERLPAALEDPWSLGAEIADEVAAVEDDLRTLRTQHCVSWVPTKNLCVLRIPRAVDPRASHEIADCDRVLELREGDGGTYAELRLSARSWFDLPKESELPRPDLAAIAARLQERERGDGAWRADSPSEPFPKIAFGMLASGPGPRERGVELRPSTLSPKEILECILPAL
jgi:hypothetical protein